MNVYLIRSGEVEDHLYTGIFELLLQIPGPYSFQLVDKPYETSIEDEVRLMRRSDPEFHFQQSEAMVLESTRMHFELLSWRDLFKPCREIRSEKQLENNDVVILLTSHGNHQNWFTGYDTSGANNIFIQTSLWDSYLQVDPRYPISYQLITALLKTQLFESPKELFNKMHMTSTGCMLDFCKNKSEITLKMRTADVCTDCQKIFSERHLPIATIRYTFDMMEEIRKQLLFRSNYVLLNQHTTLLIKGHMNKLYIPELGMLQLALTPLERSVYLLFLNHPEGIRLSCIIDHKEELRTIIHRLSNRDDRDSIEDALTALCDATSNSLSEKLARIKSKLKHQLGNDIAAPLLIQGPNGGVKSIAFDRQNVKYEE